MSSNRLDPAELRADFPLLAARPGLAYLDNAATTQKPRAVLDALDRYYTTSNANVHRAVYGLAEEATRAYEAARARVARFIGAASPAEIVFTRGATEALNLAAFSLTRAFLRPGDEILLTEMEHHANLLPWQQAAAERGLVLRFIAIDENGELDPASLKLVWTERTRLVAVTHSSNVLGTINPISMLAETARRRGALFVLDAAQAAAHAALDVESLGCDLLVFSGHKVYGPMGIGVLWARSKLLERMPPWQTGGEMISSVWLDRAEWNEAPYKFEAGTPNVAGAVGLAAAMDYLAWLGLERVRAAEAELTALALERLAQVPGLTGYGPPSGRPRAPVVSFNLDGVHNHDAAQFLDREGLAVRSGHHCAQPLMRRLGLAGTVRASFSFYNDAGEIERLARALEDARRYFKP